MAHLKTSPEITFEITVFVFRVFVVCLPRRVCTGVTLLISKTLFVRILACIPQKYVYTKTIIVFEKL